MEQATVARGARNGGHEGVPWGAAGTAPAALPRIEARRLASPLLRVYRVSDPAAAFAVLAGGWLAAHLTAPAAPADVLRLSVTLADVLLLLAFVWAWPLVCEAAGMYDAALVPGSADEARRVVFAGALGSVPPLVFSLVPVGSMRPRDVAVFWPASAAAMLLARVLLRGREERLRRRAPHKVVIAGSGPRALELWREARERGELGIEILGFLDDDGDTFARATGLPRLGAVDEAERVLMRLDPDEVLVTLPVKSRYAQVQALITACERTGTEARYFADLFQFSTARPRVEREGSVALKTFADDPRRLVKRAADVLVSALALVVLVPLMAVIAIAIRIDSPGPVLYAQERYGLHRHRFRVWKFRTMAADADARQGELEARNEADGPLFKIRDDPRVTRVGRILRRASLDELPQLWNVLRGEMSLVGPRPLPVRDVGRFGEPWLMRRFSAPPGLTGLWQVHGRSDVGFDDFVAMDLQYVDRWSLGLDLRILVATVPAVVRGHGAR
jgi:exopolysaccharide biosynthesis polyprenyl glycosylphosphotransferase